ncbi:hypothetical protein CK203_037955 [Vitis vinifera]|uniref:Uncharacterized protein n=1 Tax=Vitis vinifera TaxID=29760 RepID=A0A438HNU4_VITVI|nr:hypothetical protein CK203_037955 [Vitis vinifera]
MSEGFFFGPHHLIMAALLYLREGSQKKLQELIAFPPLSKAAMPNFGASGIPLSLSWRESEFAPEQPQPAARRASPRHIPEGITVAAPAIPRAPPAAPASSQPSTSAEPRMAIPISEYRECAVHWRLLQLLRAVLLRRWQPLKHARSRCCHSGSTSCHLKAAPSPFRSATSCRALHFYSTEPHSHPSESHPPEPKPS